MKLYYLPLEPYVERYTYFMSAKDGWAEDNFKKYGVDFVRIDGESLGNTIKHGVVLDSCGRCNFALSQIQQLVKLINNGEVKDDDVIYVEDFWHPGIESLFYIRHLNNLKFKVGTFIHAQSVDDTDFAYAMRSWMRPIEQGIGNQYDFIFTCSLILRKLCIDAKIAREDNIFYVGLPYNSTRLLAQLKDIGYDDSLKKDGSVLFASRFDDEKDPMFFLDVVEACPEISFRLVNPRKNRPITSNKEVLDRLEKILSKENSNLKLINTFDKVSYYEALEKASVIFNCAHQDWVSWTLLEGVTFKCNPIYPIWKDFPLELKNDSRYLYEKRNLNECVEKLRSLVKQDFNEDLKYIVEKHDDSWHKYLQTMGLVK